MLVKRGDIFYADLGPYEGSEQGGIRPVVIIQNDVGNEHSPTVICALISSRKKHLYLPTHVLIHAKYHRGMKDSVLLLEQIRTVDKSRLIDKMGHLTRKEKEWVNKALKVSLEIK